MENKWRQCLHLEPPAGWMNDPNGLSYYKGNYHVYFQYGPDDAYGKGRRGWGHYKSPDLLRWEFTGMVLEPDIPEDLNGAYSGCAVPGEDRLDIYYTGNVKEPGDHDYILSGRGANVIHVSSTDGHVMSGKRVLLRNKDYPSWCSCHVRDPKVWIDFDKNIIEGSRSVNTDSDAKPGSADSRRGCQDDRTGGSADACGAADPVFWHMVLGARRRDDTGCVLLYRSENGIDWSYDGVLSVPDFGYMWECPDIFSAGDVRVLSISPQGMEHGRCTHQNVYSSGYFRMEKDGSGEECGRASGTGIRLSDFCEWDYGFDFYAPQTFLAPDGRRILIGWMGMGDIPYTNPTAELGWQHCLTIPRELSADGEGHILQQPVREIELLRGAAIGSVPAACCGAEPADGLEMETKVQLPFEIAAGAGACGKEYAAKSDASPEIGKNAGPAADPDAAQGAGPAGVCNAASGTCGKAYQEASETGEGFKLWLDDFAAISYDGRELELSFTDAAIGGDAAAAGTVTKGDVTADDGKALTYRSTGTADGAGESVGAGRTVRRMELKDCRDLRIIADKSSLEIFAGGGRGVMSTRFYPRDDEIAIRARGIGYTVYPLRPMDILMEE